jgi:DNA invertase Pin-like site-specific DNA recombinase
VDTYAAVVRVSQMGGRKVGSDRFHADAEQLEPIRAWAAREGVALDVLPAELGVSGGLPLEQRPSLLRAVEGCENDEYEGLVVAYLSRLGRNVREQLRVWDRVEAAGKRIVVADGSVDTATTSGRMQRTIRAAVDEEQRETQGERLNARVEASVALGIWQRRQAPTGYKRDPETRRLVPDDRADDVRWAFRARAAGASLADLAQRLGMTPTGTQRLLRNRVYLGELKVGVHHNPTAHQPLVTIEEFEAAQRDVARPARAAGKGPAMLAGLVRCSNCGHLMSRRSGRKTTYSCNLVDSRRCKEWASVSMDALDRYVEAIALAELERLSVSANPGRSADRARAELDIAERELAAYLEAVSAADVGAEAFAAGARARRAQVDAARQALRAELAHTPALPMEGTAADVWESLAAHERNTLLRGLLAAVVVRRAGGRGARVPLAERARVLAFGTALAVPVARGNEPAEILRIPLPDLDAPGVLRLPGGEDAA